MPEALATPVYPGVIVGHKDGKPVLIPSSGGEVIVLTKVCPVFTTLPNTPGNDTSSSQQFV